MRKHEERKPAPSGAQQQTITKQMNETIRRIEDNEIIVTMHYYGVPNIYVKALEGRLKKNTCGTNEKLTSIALAEWFTGEEGRGLLDREINCKYTHEIDLPTCLAKAFKAGAAATATNKQLKQ